MNVIIIIMIQHIFYTNLRVQKWAPTFARACAYAENTAGSRDYIEE